MENMNLFQIKLRLYYVHLYHSHILSQFMPLIPTSNAVDSNRANLQQSLCQAVLTISRPSDAYPSSMYHCSLNNNRSSWPQVMAYRRGNNLSWSNQWSLF